MEHNNFSIELARIALGLVIILSYPVIGFTTRNTIDKLLFQYDEIPFQLSNCQIPFRRMIIGKSKYKILYNLFIALLFVFFTWLIALLLPGIEILFSIIGATVGNLIMYLFPSIFYYNYLKFNQQLKIRNYLIIGFLFFIGLFFALSSVIVLIIQ